MKAHFQEADLWPWLTGELDDESRSLIDSHLPMCEECSCTLAAMRDFESGCADPGVWHDEEPRFTEARLRPSATLMAFAMKETEERDRARSAMTSVQRTADADLCSTIRGKAEFRTLAGARGLLDEAHGQLERVPRRSLEIATVTRELLSEIEPGRYPESALRETQALAWKETSNALRFLGDLVGAEEAIERAAEILETCPASHHVLASVDLARAILRLETERLADALGFAERAAETFLDHGDSLRWVHAKIVVAATLSSLGDSRASRETHMSLLRPARDNADTASLARIFHGIGRASVDLGEPDVAITYLYQAMSLYGELGMETERIRIRWTIGRLMIGSGKVIEGIDRLRVAEEEFELLGMLHDAAQVALERVEALLAAGQPEEVRSICVRLIDRFTREGARSSALTALAYLRDAVSEGRATPGVVRHVRGHIEALRTEPDRLFLPLPDERF